jgi:hypothetical protein
MDVRIPRCACGTQKWIRGRDAAMEAVWRDRNSGDEPFAASDIRSGSDDGLTPEWRCAACGAPGPTARIEAAFTLLRRG